MTRAVKERKPTKSETNWLKRIALSSMLKTYTGNGPIYSLAGGETIPRDVAERLIGKAWVVPDKPGLFEGCEQTWSARKP